MDPTNSIVIVWTRKSFIGSLMLCRVGFQQNLGQKSAVMDPSCVQNASSEGDWALFIRAATQNPPAFLRTPLVKLLTNGDLKKNKNP
jgi:hypothetical protein